MFEIHSLSFSRISHKCNIINKCIVVIGIETVICNIFTRSINIVFKVLIQCSIRRENISYNKRLSSSIVVNIGERNKQNCLATCINGTSSYE
ncbi:hypothetical protein DERP_001814 [Dermatophagoides pteronyssinus]|uniref:Uncharacterized protein n=1 Tax=Dermatophagoides pteronyssinus TaxID=6956 RepID=A0ABQ8JCA0_DERPT|nr:hypothetical protein DERP_001814 [Dermatophagoides pteronyssinus]